MTRCTIPPDEASPVSFEVVGVDRRTEAVHLRAGGADIVVTAAALVRATTSVLAALSSPPDWTEDEAAEADARGASPAAIAAALGRPEEEVVERLPGLRGEMIAASAAEEAAE